MGQRIGDFRNLVAESAQGGVKNGVVTTDVGHTKTMVDVNRDLVGFWMKCKAGLSHVPWVGRMLSLQRAQLSVTTEKVFSDSHKRHDLGIVTGFMKALRHEFGKEVTSMVTRGLDKTGDKPLSLRTVRKIIEQADQLKKSMERGNQLGLKFFFDASLLGGLKGVRHENDSMEELLVSRGYRPQPNATSWKDMLEPEIGNWVEKYISARVKEHPAYAKRALTSEEFTSIAREALALVDDVKSIDGITGQQLASTFSNSLTGDASAMASGLRRYAICTSLVERSLNRDNPESMFCQIAQRMAGRYGFELSGEILKSAGEHVREWLETNFEDIVKTLECENTAKSTGFSLGLEVHGKIEAVIGAHYESVRTIEESTAFSPGQKEELLAIASTRRMDLSQVRSYEQFSTGFANLLAPLQTIISSKDAVAFGELPNQLMALAKECMAGTGEHGNEKDALAIKSGMLRVAIAGLSQEKKQELYALLTSPEAQPLFSSCRFSALTGFSKIIADLGTSIGRSLKEIETELGALQVKVPVDKLSGLGLMLSMKPNSSEAVVAPDAPHRDMVSPDVNLEAMRREHGQGWVEYALKQTFEEDTGLPAQLRLDLGRSWISVNGQLISDHYPKEEPPEKSEAIATFKNAFRGEPKEAELSRTVCSLLNQRGAIPCNQTTQELAFGGMVFAHDRSEHETWRDEEGNWYVRNTTESIVYGTPNPNGTANMLETPGLMVTSVTFRIPVESLAENVPLRVEVADSTAYFNF